MSDDFSQLKWVYRANRLLQVFLVLTLFVLVNVIASLYYAREDLTADLRFSLSPESLAYLREINQPVRIIVTRPDDNAAPESKQVFGHLDDLLREYVHMSRNSHHLIEVEYIDIYRQTGKAEELVQEYGVHPDNLNAIVVASGDQYREIMGPELYDVLDTGDNVFKGEKAITSAILEVAQSQSNRIYFLKGHGEMLPADVSQRRGLSRVADFLKQRNYPWEVIDLAKYNAVPDDASVLMIAAPNSPLLPEEVEKVRQYLNDKNGRVIVFLEPAREHGMDDLFYEWGILSDDMLVLEPSEAFTAAGGDMLITRFAEHPITQLLLNSQQRVLMGLSRPVRFDPGASTHGGLTVTPLLGTSDDSWAERYYHKAGEPDYDPAIDLPGPVSIAVASERGDASDIGLDLPGGKLLVFGNAAFVSNQRFSIAANSILFHNILNWSLERGQLLNIPPRSYKLKQLTLSQRDLTHIFLILMSIPAALAFMGIGVAIIRRR